jgi:secondary thiamine-phosphate synthase enzyme
MWTQKEIIIKNKSRGFHLIKDEIIRKLPELKKINIGILHIFINHTSASLTINENSDSSVRTDLESHFNRMVPEKNEFYTHTFEGEDDMPAHLKAAILGSSLFIPIKNGNLNLGIWQGVFLCEHRNKINSRKITVTINGE